MQRHGLVLDFITSIHDNLNIVQKWSFYKVIKMKVSPVSYTSQSPEDAMLSPFLILKFQAKCDDPSLLSIVEAHKELF